MPKFEVRIKRTVESTTMVGVTAASEELAHDKAIAVAEKMEEGPESLDWELYDTTFDSMDVTELKEEDEEDDDE